MQDFEKLGMFYLGREYDLPGSKLQDNLVLYDAKDLNTHAVCVGMTGSGKTGLCIGLLEEAAIDGIPAIAIDPKGDITNLLLSFPELQPQDFLPWINEDDARRKEQTPQEYAAAQASLWKKGLAEWGQQPERIRMLRDKADFAIYTPGSTAGLPVSLLGSMAPPPPQVLDDNELMQERIDTFSIGLLSLLGINVDPLKTREHILITNILHRVWREGRTLNLASLIQLIQKPPLEQIGVMPMESFYPSKDRFQLAMTINNLLAAPGFEAWLHGEPLQIDRFLYTPSGKPRIAIFSIAHLNDAERMFFVSLLFNEVLAWMRSKPGTTSLRALVYMDEIFGYLPPTANPPSKKPMLTLLKQARAFGVGIVLATQNPVDLDYKALSNTGTWFIGRLQTERDKARVLDGLEGAAISARGGFDRRTMEQTLAALGKRVFLMNNVNESEPVVFQTRWVMSYLRGPMTRTQIKTLMDTYKATAAPATASGAAAASAAAPSQASPSIAAKGSKPVLSPSIRQFFAPVRLPAAGGEKLYYAGKLVGHAAILFDDSRAKVRFNAKNTYSIEFPTVLDSLTWDGCQPLELEPDALQSEPAAAAQFLELPNAATIDKNYGKWEKEFADLLYRNETLKLYAHPTLKESAKPGESQRDFMIRINELAIEQRDAELEKLRKKYDQKLSRLQGRLQDALRVVEREAAQAQQQKYDTIVSFGTTLLGAVLGRKSVSSTTLRRASSSARSASRMQKEAQDVARAREKADTLQQEIDALESELRDETNRLRDQFDVGPAALTTTEVKPKKQNISVRFFALTWVPYWQQSDGSMRPAWG